MSPIFLRGRGVALHPTGAGPAVGDAVWLDAGAREGDEILMALHDAAGREEALVGLAQLDWCARSARLVAGAADPTRPPEPARLEAALALVLAYARDELALETLDAHPRHDAADGLLDRLGFARPRGGPRRFAFPDPLRGR